MCVKKIINQATLNELFNAKIRKNSHSVNNKHYSFIFILRERFNKNSFFN